MCVAALVDVPDPEAEKIVPVLDRRTTHAPASLYAACPPAGATRLADELEHHHTPKHGSWRTMAEVELSARRRRGLRRRLPDRGATAREVGAWATRRNDQTHRVDRQVTTADARTTLERLYPACEA